MQKVIGKLKAIYVVFSSIGVIVPGYTFFTKYAPPLFKEITLITSALTIAFVIYSLTLDQLKKEKLLRRGLGLIFISFVTLLLYLASFDMTTVEINSSVEQA